MREADRLVGRSTSPSRVAFGGWIWRQYGCQQGVEYYTGYLVEKSLSVDNLFVFILLLSAFAVPRELHQRVLLIGVAGALVLRGVFIALGAQMIASFAWTFLLFGAILLATAVKVGRDALSHADHGSRRRLSCAACGCSAASAPSPTSYAGTQPDGRARTGAGRSPRSPSSPSPSSAPTSSSRSTRCRPSTASPATPTSSSPRTPSPCSACARSTSSSRAPWPARPPRPRPGARSSPSSASSSSCTGRTACGRRVPEIPTLPRSASSSASSPSSPRRACSPTGGRRRGRACAASPSDEPSSVPQA